MPIDLILGTAGHIDHGKTALVKALTGVDTDRLPEEKKRGITIELGFAELVLDDVRLGIVDVPGHERFVRTMLAGATGIDLALLVVAADDSVKPQTREHLEILRLLDLPAGVIALAKCDLADHDWIELVEAEIRELVAGTVLARAPIVRTSAATGAGLDELRRELARAAAEVAQAVRGRQRSGPFRMAIDRSFTIAGHGTVVTGSVLGGEARVGDELVVEPGRVAVRIRGLQNHDRPAEEVHRGQRAAINLAGVHHDELRRGQELATPGHLVPSTLITARLNLLPAARSLKNRSRVRLHVGTAELMATVVLLSSDRLEPGGSALAQLFLSQPAVMTWNQPLVIRSQSPSVTIGGGVVLDPAADKIRRSEAEKVARLEQLASADPHERASAALYFAGWHPWQPQELARTAGIENVDEVTARLAERGELCQFRVSPTRQVRVHRDVVEELCDRVHKSLERLHEQSPLQRMVARSKVAQRFAYLVSPTVLDMVLERMAAAGRIELSDAGIALAGRGPKLSANEQKLHQWIIQTFRDAKYQPPTVKELQQQATTGQGSIGKLVTLVEEEGHLVKVSGEFYLHHEVERQMRHTLSEALSDGRGLTLSQIREILGTSRKYAVPFCEYLDRIGFTRREGDLRLLSATASASP